jgi:hypothetical protein
VARPKLIGVGVYGPGDKQVGKIDDLMVDRTDATQTIVIGVGAPDGLANLLERRVAGKRLGRPTKQTGGTRYCAGGEAAKGPSWNGLRTNFTTSLTGAEGNACLPRASYSAAAACRSPSLADSRSCW